MNNCGQVWGSWGEGTREKGVDSLVRGQFALGQNALVFLHTPSGCQLIRASGSKIGRGSESPPFSKNMEVSSPYPNQFQALQDLLHDYPNFDSSSSISSSSFLSLCQSPLHVWNRCDVPQCTNKSGHHCVLLVEEKWTDKVRFEKGGLSPMMSEHVMVDLQGGKESCTSNRANPRD